MFAQSDLATVYEGELASEKRGVAIVDKKFVVIRDELATVNKATTVRWTMMTSADVKLGSNAILLSKEGHTLSVKINATSKIKMKTWSTEPTTTYDAPNPGKTLVGFEMQLKPNQKQTIQVLLIPGSCKDKKIIFDKKLSEW
jgi:hypothetical protein